MITTKKSVLIVGAGLAGIAMYLALDKNKFDVEIIEKRQKLKRLGFALIFMPPGVRALKKLGFTTAEINSLGSTIKENRLKNEQGKTVLVTDLSELIRIFDVYMIVTRKRLYDLLEKKITARTIRFGRSIKNISMRGNKVRVQFDGTIEQKEYDVVIGADGVYSSVRKVIFPSAKLSAIGLSLIWTWVPQKNQVYERQFGTIGNEKKGVAFFNSGESGKTCIAFFLQTKDIPDDITPEIYKTLLQGYFKNFEGPVPKILKQLPTGKNMYLHSDHELELKKWNKGNIVLIGDAAHARSTFSGTGSALALEDAYTLGHYLNQESDISTAIKKFTLKQKPRVDDLAMSKLSLYLSDQRKITNYLKKFFSSSLLYAQR